MRKMSSLNKVILIGNVGKDPETSNMTSGGKVCMFSLATSDTWKDKVSGEQKQRTEWHNVVVFNERLISVVEQYIKKGTKLYVEGQVQTRPYKDKQGKDVYITEIVLQKFKGDIIMLQGKSEGEPTAKPEFTSQQYQAKFGDDEIPF